jgi:hypothetical protein
MILFSRIVVLRNFLPIEMAITAIGIEAETVSPALSARYTVAAPKMTPNKEPINIDLMVNSLTLSVAEIYGLNSLFSIGN